MATLTLSRWGNAQALRIPKELREQVGISEGSQLEASVSNGAILLKPIRNTDRIVRVPRLSERFKNRKEPYQAEEDPFGAPVGREKL